MNQPNQGICEACDFREISIKLQRLILHEVKIPIPQIRGDSYRMGYNKAIKDAQKIIKELKK